jgi:hypothetical protein
MHVVTIRLLSTRPEAGMVEAILGMTILAIVGLSTIALLPWIGIV